ncbi:MAG: tetratricopeptide repeat protein [Treponema sp.]|nr:tetratricopeptide repeat protein [Treponema sp.]
MAENKLLLSRAKSAVLSRDYDVAARLYKQLLGESPDNEALLQELGAVYSKSGKDSQALSVYQKINQINPKNIDALITMGAIYRRMQLYDNSVKILESARQIDFSNMQVVYNLGFTYKSMGRYDDAIACFEDVIDQNPNDVLAYNHIGTIYAEQGEYETAISSYLRALKVDSNHPVIQLNLAKSYEAVGDMDKAIAAYESSLRAKPGWLEAVGGYSDLLVKTNRIHDAFTILRNALNVNPKDAKTHVQLGNVYTRKSVFDSAEREYKLALEQESSNNEALVGLAMAQEYQEHHKEAATTISKAEKNRPSDTDITQKAAHILLSANEYAAAFERISRLREQNPKDVQALSLLGQYYICNGDWQKVEECYSKIAEYDPSFSEHYRDGAKRFKQRGDMANEERYLRKAIEKNPNDARAMVSLGQLLENASREKEAFSVYQQASDADEFNEESHKAVARLETVFGTVDVTNYVPPAPEEEPAKDAVEKADAAAESDSLDGLFDEDWVDVESAVDSVVVPSVAGKYTAPEDEPEQTIFDAASLSALAENDEERDAARFANGLPMAPDPDILAAAQDRLEALDDTLQNASDAAEKAEYAAQQAWNAAQQAADSAQVADIAAAETVRSADSPLPAAPSQPAPASPQTDAAQQAPAEAFADAAHAGDASAFGEAEDAPTEGASTSGAVEDFGAASVFDAAEDVPAEEADIPELAAWPAADLTEEPAAEAAEAPESSTYPESGFEGAAPSGAETPALGDNSAVEADAPDGTIIDDTTPELEAEPLEELSAPSPELDVESLEELPADLSSELTADPVAELLPELAEDSSELAEAAHAGEDSAFGVAEDSGAASAFDAAEDVPAEEVSTSAAAEDAPAAQTAQTAQAASADFGTETEPVYELEPLDGDIPLKHAESSVTGTAVLSAGSPLGVFERLRALCEFLPQDYYDKFMSSRKRLLLDYVISRLSGNAGLLQQAAAQRSDSAEGYAAADEDGIQLATHVVDDVLTLIQDIPDSHLRAAMETTTKDLVEKLIAQ